MVQLLLGKPQIEVNKVDANGHTALYLASEGGHSAVVELLLGLPSIKVKVNGGRQGRTALYIASLHFNSFE